MFAIGRRHRCAPTPPTPDARTVAVPAELYRTAAVLAGARGRSVDDVVVTLLRRWTRERAGSAVDAAADRFVDTHPIDGFEFELPPLRTTPVATPAGHPGGDWQGPVY